MTADVVSIWYMTNKNRTSFKSEKCTQVQSVLDFHIFVYVECVFMDIFDILYCIEISNGRCGIP